MSLPYFKTKFLYSDVKILQMFINMFSLWFYLLHNITAVQMELMGFEKIMAL
jgi:hypothetical protein